MQQTHMRTAKEGSCTMGRLIDKIDRNYAKVCLYAGVTVVLTAAALMVLKFASPVFTKFWLLVCTVLEPMVYGAAISYVLNPLVKWISHHLQGFAIFSDGGRRRVVAVICALLLVLLLALALVAVFMLMITHSIANLNFDSLLSLFGLAEGVFSNIIAQAEGYLEEWGFATPGSGFDMMSLFSSAKNAASTVVFAIIFGVYFLIDGPRVSRYLGRVMRAVMGKHAIDPTSAIEDADRVFSGYFRGQGTDAFVVGVLAAVVLTVIGVPYAPLIALFTGLGNMIPYVGGPVGFVSIALVCLPGGDWTTMATGFLGLAVVMFIDANVINPRLLSESVEVHPILVVAALIAGGAVGGIAGMLVAVPTAAWIKTQVDRWVVKREAEELAEAVPSEE